MPLVVVLFWDGMGWDGTRTAVASSGLMLGWDTWNGKGVVVMDFFGMGWDETGPGLRLRRSVLLGWDETTTHMAGGRCLRRGFCWDRTGRDGTGLGLARQETIASSWFRVGMAWDRTRTGTAVVARTSWQ